MYTVNYTNFFDFGVDMGDDQLNRIDDGSSPPINLSTPIQFFGRTQHNLFVSQLYTYIQGPFMMMGVSYIHWLVVINNNIFL